MNIRRRPRWLSAVVLATVITGSGSLAGPVSAREFQFNPSTWLDLVVRANEFIPALGQVAQTLTGGTGGENQALSYNGKLTVLLVGSDYRSGSERLDTIMVMSIDSSKVIKAVSIPRDSARIPLYTGGTYNGKINGMYSYFKNQSGGSRATGLDKFRQQIQFLLDIRIDYVAYTRFNGFDALVDRVVHVTSNIPGELRDPKYIDKPTWPKGAKFLADPTAQLKGANTERCYGGYPKPVTNWGPVMNCDRAIVYVRSRKGSIGSGTNNDYKRAARQQKFIFEAIKRVTDDYTSSITSGLRTVTNSMPNDIYTTLPSSSDLELWNKLNGSSFNTSTGSKVFSPPTYASHIRGTSSNQLNLTAIRNLCNSWFDDV